MNTQHTDRELANFEVPTWENVRGALAMMLFGASGKSSSVWCDVLDEITTADHGPLAEMRKLLPPGKAKQL